VILENIKKQQEREIREMQEQIREMQERHRIQNAKTRQMIKKRQAEERRNAAGQYVPAIEETCSASTP